MQQELRCAGAAVPVEPQVFDVLAYLLQHRDRIVSKDELFETVWQGRVVSDAALNSRISAARRAVGDDGSAQKVIRTIHKRGFRFVGEVEEDGAQRPRAPSSREAAPRGCADARARRRAGRAAAAAEQAVDRGAAVPEHERRSGAGLFRRRPHRGHHHRAVAAAMVLRDRAQLVLHLQGRSGRRARRSRASSACATSSRGACANRRAGCASPAS